jgi:hypothetical protein
MINVDNERKLTHTRLLELLEYHPDTGIFTHKISRGRSIKGKAAGNLSDKGYVRISIDGVHFKAHRLAWFYCFQEWPDGLLDHEDKNKSNNRLDNLREATSVQNGHNTHLYSNNSTGFTGVSWHVASGKFIAQIRINSKTAYLGLYTSAQDASEAYQKVAKQHFGEFANT